MGLYKYLREAWKRPLQTMPDNQQERLIAWRREPATVRILKPTRLDRARSLGYKAKQGFVLVRQRLKRGGRMRSYTFGGRRPKANRRTLVLDKSYQAVAEVRASKSFPNCEVLNSYWVAQDGKNYWYEVILIDRAHPNIRNDPMLRKIASMRGRANRGLTSAGKKSRGLRNKGAGAEKIR
ncbi:50S ribosomal protein L15e [Candidatus Woesearchaeota archaeon]|nr:50S ribosomal protein L15e [Candidatus Woesearchaeota archaeon]